MTEPRSSSYPPPRERAIEALWAVVRDRFDELCAQLCAALADKRVPGLLSSEDERARLPSVLAGLRGPLEKAVAGDWGPLEDRAHDLGRLLGERGGGLGEWIGAVRAARQVVHPALVEAGAASPERLLEALHGLEVLAGRLTGRVARELEARQVESERDALFLHSVIENIPNMIFVKDAEDLRFVRFNKAGEELLGYSREQLIGKTDRDFFPPAEADFFTRNDREVLAGGKLVDIPKEPILTRHQGERILHTKKIPILDEHGRPTYLLGISEDITDRERVLDELERAKEAAEAGSRAKSIFVARMSHEVRTPMSGIIGMTDLALRTDLDDEQREYLDLIKGSAESLLSVLNEILDFSRIEAGRLEIARAIFDLPRVIERTVKFFRPAARGKKLDLHLELDPGLPRTVVGDPSRLRQVVVNLLDNAIRFTERGGITVIARALRSEGSRVDVQFSITDSGIGIAAEERQDIFEAFSQADSSLTRRQGGTGLGLTISTGLVRRMGGELWLESEKGKGSTFHFTVSLELPVAEDDHLRRREPGDRPALPSLRVLLAEDDPVSQKLAHLLLTKMGHRVNVVGSGDEALRALDAGPFDLILMDLEMPRMDGLEATRRIRAGEQASGGHIPIVALTAHTMRGDRDRCLEAGMNGHVAKPLREETLVSAMAAALAATG